MSIKPNNKKHAIPFKAWTQKVLPTVYDDSLSYSELLYKVLNNINILIENNNLMIDDIQTLYDYVNDYFENLDVQTEIDNKLEQMYQSGQLDELFKKYLDPKLAEQDEKIDNSLNAQNSKITVLESRMNEFTALKEGSTTGDAELQDIRVGYDGETYPNAGDAVRGQVGELFKQKVGVGLSVTKSSYSELNIHSIYDLPVNSVNIVSGLTNDMVSGLPEYGSLGTLIRINPKLDEDEENEFSCYLYYGYNGILYYTFGNSKSTINKWNKVQTIEDNAIVSAKIGKFVNKDVLDSNNIHSIYDMPINSISALSSAITEEQLRGLPVYGKVSTFIKFNPYTSPTTKDQFSIFLLFNADEMWYTFGLGNTANSGWKKITFHTDVSTLNEVNNGFSAFSKFAVVGDSLSVGYYTDSEGVQHSTDYYHSWPAYVGRLNGTTPYWCGASGQTCRSWLAQNSGDWGLEYTKSLGIMPLYVIAMGANESGIAIGTPADIGTDSATLYGYVSKTIEELRKISPKSYIVCTGISRGQGLNNKINDVYEEVCTHYDKCYYMNVESELNSEEFKQYYFKYHYSALGYLKMGMLYDYKLCEIMDNNVSDFLYINETDVNVEQPK